MMEPRWGSLKKSSYRKSEGKMLNISLRISCSGRSGDRRSGFCRGLNRGAVAFLPFFRHSPDTGANDEKSGVILPLPRVVPLRGPTLGLNDGTPLGFSEKVILSEIRRKDVEYFFENKLFGPIRRSALRLLQNGVFHAMLPIRNKIDGQIRTFTLRQPWFILFA